MNFFNLYSSRFLITFLLFSMSSTNAGIWSWFGLEKKLTTNSLPAISKNSVKPEKSVEPAESLVRQINNSLSTPGKITLASFFSVFGLLAYTVWNYLPGVTPVPPLPISPIKPIPVVPLPIAPINPVLPVDPSSNEESDSDSDDDNGSDNDAPDYPGDLPRLEFVAPGHNGNISDVLGQGIKEFKLKNDVNRMQRLLDQEIERRNKQKLEDRAEDELFVGFRQLFDQAAAAHEISDANNIPNILDMEGFLECNRLRNQLRQSTNKINTLNDLNEQKRQRAEMLEKQKLDDRAEDELFVVFRDLFDQSTRQAEINEWQNKLDIAKNQIDATNNDSKNKSDQLKKADEDKKEFDFRIQEDSKIKEELYKQFDDKVDELNLLKNDLAQQRDQVKQLNMQIQGLKKSDEESKKEFNKQLEAKNTIIKSIKDETADLRIHLDDSNIKNQGLDKQINLLQHKLSEATENINVLDQKIINKDQEVEKLNELHKQALEKESFLKKSGVVKDICLEELNNNNKKLELEKQNLLEEQGAQQNQIKLLKQEQVNLQNNFEDSQNQIRSAQTQINYLKKDKSKASEQLTEMKKQNDDLIENNKGIDQLKKEIKDLNSKNNDLDNQVNALQTDLKEAGNKLENQAIELDQKVKKLEETIQAHEQNVTNYENELRTQEDKHKKEIKKMKLDYLEDSEILKKDVLQVCNRLTFCKEIIKVDTDKINELITNSEVDQRKLKKLEKVLKLEKEFRRDLDERCSALKGYLRDGKEKATSFLSKVNEVLIKIDEFKKNITKDNRAEDLENIYENLNELLKKEQEQISIIYLAVKSNPQDDQNKLNKVLEQLEQEDNKIIVDEVDLNKDFNKETNENDEDSGQKVDKLTFNIESEKFENSIIVKVESEDVKDASIKLTLQIINEDTLETIYENNFNIHSLQQDINLKTIINDKKSTKIHNKIKMGKDNNKTLKNICRIKICRKNELNLYQNDTSLIFTPTDILFNEGECFDITISKLSESEVMIHSESNKRTVDMLDHGTLEIFNDSDSLYVNLYFNNGETELKTTYRINKGDFFIPSMYEELISKYSNNKLIMSRITVEPYSVKQNSLITDEIQVWSYKEKNEYNDGTKIIIQGGDIKGSYKTRKERADGVYPFNIRKASSRDASPLITEFRKRLLKDSKKRVDIFKGKDRQGSIQFLGLHEKINPLELSLIYLSQCNYCKEIFDQCSEVSVLLSQITEKHWDEKYGAREVFESFIQTYIPKVINGSFKLLVKEFIEKEQYEQKIQGLDIELNKEDLMNLAIEILKSEIDKVLGVTFEKDTKNESINISFDESNNNRELNNFD